MASDVDGGSLTPATMASGVDGGSLAPVVDQAPLDPAAAYYLQALAAYERGQWPQLRAALAQAAALAPHRPEGLEARLTLALLAEQPQLLRRSPPALAGQRPAAPGSANELVAARRSERGEAYGTSGPEVIHAVELALWDTALWTVLAFFWGAVFAGGDGEAFLASGLTGLYLGATGFGLWAGLGDIQPGFVPLHVWSQLWGAYSGLALALVATDGDVGEGWYALSATAGAATGLVVTAALGERLALPRGDAELVASLSFWGAMLGLSSAGLLLGDEVFDDHWRVTQGLLLAGGWGGLALGALLRPGLPARQVRLMNLGAVAGWLLIGMPILLNTDDGRNERARYMGPLGGILVGGLLGLLVGATGAHEEQPAPLAGLLTWDQGLGWGLPLLTVDPGPWGPSARLVVAAGRW